MKIAVPVENGWLNPHFGQSSSFEIFRFEDGSGKVAERCTATVPKDGGCGMLAGWLVAQGVDMVVCGGLGQGAMAKLHHAGIEVFYGAPVMEASELVQALLSGTLQPVRGLCDHHHHDHAAGEKDARGDGHGSSCCGRRGEGTSP